MKLPATNKYRVSGAFSYWHGDTEKVHTVSDIEALGDNEEEATRDAIETLRISMDYHDACWLIGYPTVAFVTKVTIGPYPNITQYWKQSSSEQERIRKEVHYEREK